MTAFGMEKTAHILLADDDYQVLSALRLVLEQEPAWLVASEFHNAADMIRYFENAGQWFEACNSNETGHSIVLLIDWELPGFQPKNHIKSIRSVCPGIKIVGLSVMLAGYHDALTTHVDAFVSKSEAPERVIDVLQALIHPN